MFIRFVALAGFVFLVSICVVSVQEGKRKSEAFQKYFGVPAPSGDEPYEKWSHVDAKLSALQATADLSLQEFEKLFAEYESALIHSNRKYNEPIEAYAERLERLRKLQEESAQALIRAKANATSFQEAIDCLKWFGFKPNHKLKELKLGPKARASILYGGSKGNLCYILNMISEDDIKKLAELARIEVSDGEAESLGGEISSILEYVGQVKSVVGDEKEGVEFGPVWNVMREDENPNESGSFSKELIAEFPDKEGDYLKVKKIL